MNTEELIDRIRREQAATALNACKAPRSHDDFEYGFVCGLVQGYERALQLIVNKEAPEEDGKPAPPGGLARAVGVTLHNPYLFDLDNVPLLPEQWHKGSRR